MLTTNMNRSAINLLGVLSFTPLLAILYLILMPFFLNGGANIAPFLIVAWLTWIGVLLLFVIFFDSIVRFFGGSTLSQLTMPTGRSDDRSECRTALSITRVMFFKEFAD